MLHSPHYAGDEFLVGLVKNLLILYDSRNPFPRTSVRGSLKASVAVPTKSRIAIKPSFRIEYEVYDAAVQIIQSSPGNPFRDRRTETVHIESRKKRRVKFHNLIILSVIYGRDYSAAFRELASRKLTIKCEIHDGLKHLRPCTVKLIQKQDNRLVVLREPIWRDKNCPASGFVKAREPNQITRVALLLLKPRMLRIGRFE